MVSIEITPRELVVRIRGWDRVRALRSTLSIPWAHVTGVRVRPREGHYDDVIIESWRGVGTYRRGSVAAGRVYTADGSAFYDVHDPEKAIAIDLVSEPIRRVVVEIADEPPERAARRIQRAMEARAELSRDAAVPARISGSTASRPEPRPAAWKIACAVAAAILFAPVGALTAFYLVATVVPLLFFVVPAFAKSSSS